MKKELTFIFFLGFSISVFAQFDGGKGDGMDKSGAVQLRLNGTVGSIAPLFQGGSGDGTDNNVISSWLNGANASTLYSGGSGDGFVRKTASLYLNGTNTNSLYSGGSGDGFDKKTYSGFLNNTGAIALYNGGSGDGFDKKIYSGFLDNTGAVALYNGGSGDGFDHGQIQSFLSGVSTAILYSGGEGDGFAKASINLVLPIELLSFDAEAKENFVLVKWVTANEQGTDFYTVERSQNGMLFNDLKVVPGQGNSSTLQVYTTNDNDPLQGRSYYRLKWEDTKGKSKYSEIRSVIFDKNNSKDFLLFPNPNDGSTVYLKLDGITPNENIAISLTDIQGKMIYQSNKPTLTSDRITMTLPKKLIKGSYVVHVVRNGESSSKVLIVR